MKYIKLFENFEEIDKLNESWFKRTFMKRKFELEDIHKICEKYNITDYTINEDGSIDVDGNVNLSQMELTKLPIKFNNVSGDFECQGNKLTTLEGAPQSVGGGFYCFNNKLTSLEGGPQSVGGDFYCNYNNLTTLLGSPQSVGGGFWCHSNKILTFEGAPNHVGAFGCGNNPIENIWDLFRDYSKVELLNDLDPIRGKDILMDRFNTFLSMIGKDDVLSVKGYNCIN